MKKYFLLILILCVTVFGGCSAEPERNPNVNTPVQTVEDTHGVISQSDNTASPQIPASSDSKAKPEEPEKEIPLQNSGSNETGTVQSNLPKNSSMQKEPQNSEPDTVSDEKSEVVTISILTPSETLLDSAEIKFTEGCSVLDVLLTTCNENDISIVTTGVKSLAYIKSIADIAEFQDGPLSGWIYEVNGVRPSKSCGAYNLISGDVVVWRYATDGK